MRVSVLLFVAFLFSVRAQASLVWGDAEGGVAPRRDVVLLNFGEAVEPVTVIASDGVVPVVETDSDLVEVSSPSISDDGAGNRNYTYEFTFANDVGIVPYSVSAPGSATTLTGTFVLAGFVLKEAGKVVSGDAQSGVSVGQDGMTSYDVTAVGTDGGPVDLSGTVVTPGRMDGGVYMKEVDESKTGFSGSKFILAINRLRVGTGSFSINFETPSITTGGETFETVLHVSQETSPEPTCVVMGATLLSKGGVIEAKMFNLLTPPRRSPVKEISLSIGGRMISFDSGRSSLELPTSTVVFTTVSGEGAAEITCDGVPAVVIEDGEIVESGLTVAVDGASETLAKDTMIEALPSSTTDDVISSLVRVVDSDPDALTTTIATVIKNEYCSSVSATGDCVITNITKGSAVIGFGATVDDYSKSQDAVKGRFDSCMFQTSTGFPCDKLELVSTEPANALAGAASAGGIAVWTIVLVSCIGALSLIALIVLSVWAVHRRTATNRAESSYSSSGPLGVPDPSDMLYEQSIVRDIYGRGPDGGLTQDDADTSQRMAAMREEFPRPPSSGSGLSRRASDEASSTYSV